MGSIGEPDFPFAREHGFEPTPTNAELRHNDPVSKVRLFDGSDAWIVMKRKDICKALASKDLSADRRADGYPEIHEGGAKAKEQRPTFVNLDDPEHDRQRQMLEPWFTEEAVNKMKPLIQKIVDQHLDRMIATYGDYLEKPVDLIQEFAALVPTEVVYRILGVPDDDIPTLIQDSEARTSTSRNAAESSNNSLQQYMSKMVDERMSQSRNDLISDLVENQLKQGHLEKEDVVNLAFLVLVAGNAALINSIALGVITLLQHPQQLEELRKNAMIAPRVVNELLRYHTASALNSRRAARADVEIGGQRIKAGEGVICSVQSADRDEEYYSAPDRLDIHRDHAKADVLGFGYGQHRCQGEWLSRVELELVFSTLFQRLPNLRLAADPGELEYTPPTQNIGVQRLPVLW